MGKLPGYTGSIDLISGIRQKNNGTFALAEANAIQTRDDGTRLDAELESIKSSILNIAIPTASDATPKAAGTASAGTGTNWSRDDHVHPIQTSVSGNAGTATKLANSRTLNISGVTAEGASFDGSDDATIKITQIPVAIISGLAGVATSGKYSDLSGTPSLATVATSGKYSDLSGTPSIPNASDATPKAAGTAAAGSGTTWARSDHVHPVQTSVSGNAGTATKLATARNIVLSGAISSSAEFDGSDDIELAVTSVDGSKITGVIPLSSIPKGAQERFVPVADDAARLALTTEDVQNGDVVKVEDSGIMYYIADDAKLGTEGAFAVFTAGAASSVAWSGITGKPTFATVATSGKYTDLSDTPDFAAVATSGAYSDLSGTPSLATVATSGKYSDLSGTPSIPSASNATPKVAGTATAGSGTTWARADHVHPAQTSVSGNAGTATKLATARNIVLSGAISSSAEFDGSNDVNLTITSVDGSKITGVIPLSSIPKGAQERFVPVANDTARLALTSSDAQNGDVVKVESDGIMYYIVDDTKLGTEDAFAVFTAGAASSVAWSGITGKPTFAAVATSGSYSDLVDTPNFATVATSGKYTDLTDTPNFATVATSGKYSDLSGTPVLASVATSGKYSDLSGIPSIPNASDATPKVAGTATPGSGTTWSRADHVHPAQTNITGNAGSATKAVKDNKDQQIDATYIKSISVSGKIITITKGDNTTSTITTQDTVSNAFGKVVINGTTISADAATDSLNIEAGDNINITPDATNDKVTISADNPSTTYNATIGTEWAGNEAPYTQTITITGITVNDTPIVDIITNNSDYEALTTQLEEFGSIYRITTAANSITVYTTKKTTVEIPIQLKCVK